MCQRRNISIILHLDDHGVEASSLAEVVRDLTAIKDVVVMANTTTSVVKTVNDAIEEVLKNCISLKNLVIHTHRVEAEVCTLLTENY